MIKVEDEGVHNVKVKIKREISRSIIWFIKMQTSGQILLLTFAVRERILS